MNFGWGKNYIFILTQCFSAGIVLSSFSVTLGRLILETFLVIATGWEGTVGIKWIEGRDASKKIPTTKSCPVQNVNSAMVEINPALTGF